MFRRHHELMVWPSEKKRDLSKLRLPFVIQESFSEGKLSHDLCVPESVIRSTGVIQLEKAGQNLFLTVAKGIGLMASPWSLEY